MPHTKKHSFPIHISKKTLKFFYQLVLVYILLLGVFNIGFLLARPRLESALKDALEAETIELGYMANVPFLYVSISRMNVRINSNLSFELKNLYFRYRFWEALRGRWELFPASFSVDKTEINMHSSVLRDYTDRMKKKYPIPSKQDNQESTEKISFDPRKMVFRVQMRNTAVTVRSMTAYRVDLTMNNIQGLLNRDVLNWKANLNLQTKWSNQVGILFLDSFGDGVISNLSEPIGDFTVGVNSLNLGGIPFITSAERTEILGLNFNLDRGRASFNTVTGTLARGEQAPPQGVSLQGDQENFQLVIDKIFEIKYNTYEEYQMLDYAYKPGKYRLYFSLNNQPDWGARLRISSSDHPGFGADIGFHSQGGGDYSLPVYIKTHKFGSLTGDLTMEDRAGLMPFPSGVLDLDRVRFLLPGLVFSGRAEVKALKGKNNLDITAYNASMNGGRIGNARIDLGLYNGSHLIIKPLPFSNDVEVYVDVDRGVDVRIKANNLDGDFFRENTKMAVFGLDTSVYKGDVYIRKEPGLGREVIVDGSMDGFLDEEHQIEVRMQYTNDQIVIPRLYFISQKILVQGAVDIKGNHTNTTVDIAAKAQLGSPEMLPEDSGRIIPIDVSVLLEEEKVDVKGLVDGQVPFSAKALGADVDLNFQFKEYSLQKLTAGGKLSGDLAFRFNENGWSGFNFENGRWILSDRVISLDFASQGDTNFLMLDRFRAGVDNEVLEGLPGGYIDVRKGIGGAVRFVQGGSLRFLVGTYTLKGALDLRQFRIDDLFTLPIAGPLASLQGPSTEIIYASINAEINGTFSDPDIEGSFNLTGDSLEKIEIVQQSKRRQGTEALDNPSFQFISDRFRKIGDEFIVDNLRLRHPQYNIDGNIRFARGSDGAFDADISGAMAVFGNAVKSGMTVSIKKNPDSGILEYKIPNLYVFSKKPMSMTGKILQQGSRIVLVSDDSRFGISGYYNSDPQERSWNVLFQTDALRLNSEGNNRSDSLTAFLEGQILLDKLNMSRPIKRLKGSAEIHLRAEGSLDNPILNGNILLSDLVFALDSLRHPLRIPVQTEIKITSNYIEIPDSPILAGANQFGIKGWASVQDKAIEEIDLSFYSRQGLGLDAAALDWRINVPLLSVRGQTAIDYFRIFGSGDNLQVDSKIIGKNMNLNLELGDILGGVSADNNNPILALLALINFNIDFTLGTGARFSHQLFDFRFIANQKIMLLGNLGDGSLSVSGNVPIQSGVVNYLGKSLKIEEGYIAFSGDGGDPFPDVNVDTSVTEKSIQGDQITVNVNFGGKAPNIRLASISSTPPRSREEIFGLLGFGGTGTVAQSATNTVNNTQSILASSVGLAENTLFIAPLTQRLRRTLGFFDSLQVKTDILGNLTRSLSLGNSLTGLALFNGSEIEVGKNIAFDGMQLRYNLRFENPPNLALDNNINGPLRQQHRIGIRYDYRTPSLWQLAVGVGGQITVDPPAGSSAASGTLTTGEVLLEGSIRRSFGWGDLRQRAVNSEPAPVFE